MVQWYRQWYNQWYSGTVSGTVVQSGGEHRRSANMHSIVRQSSGHTESTKMLNETTKEMNESTASSDKQSTLFKAAHAAPCTPRSSGLPSLAGFATSALSPQNAALGRSQPTECSPRALSAHSPQIAALGCSQPTDCSSRALSALRFKP